MKHAPLSLSPRCRQLTSGSWAVRARLRHKRGSIVREESRFLQHPAVRFGSPFSLVVVLGPLGCGVADLSRDSRSRVRNRSIAERKARAAPPERSSTPQLVLRIALSFGL